MRTSKGKSRVVVPLAADANTTVSHFWSEEQTNDNTARGLTLHTLQIFERNAKGQVESSIVKVLPSLDNAKKNVGKNVKSPFDGLMLYFSDAGAFTHAERIRNGKITGTSQTSRGGRVAGCSVTTISIPWRICVGEGPDTYCNSGVNTHTVMICTAPPVEQTDTPTWEMENGGGGGDGGIDYAMVEFLENFYVLGPEKPIKNTSEYLKCFKLSPNATYKISIHVDQPVTNSISPISTNNNGHPVGHTYITLEQYGGESQTIRRTLGWYPKEGVFNGSIDVPGTFGQDDYYSAGYDVSISYIIDWNQLKIVIDYINNFTGNYNLIDRNCADFAIQALNKVNIFIPDYEQQHLGVNIGSTPSRLRQDIRNIPLPTNATRYTDGGMPLINEGDCN